MSHGNSIAPALRLSKPADTHKLSPAACSLRALKPGEKGVIESIEPGTPEIRQRLLEMGLVNGTAIECIRFAPLGDPMQVRIDRTNVSLRIAEARLVLVRRTV